MHIGRFTQSPYEQVAAATSSVAAVTPPVTPLTAVRPPVTDQDEGTILGAVPPAPTAEAREMVDKAAEVVQAMHKQNRELHFSRDEITNRVVIEVRDLEGNVIKTIPPAKALDILSGAEL
jgi:FlaG protein